MKNAETCNFYRHTGFPYYPFMPFQVILLLIQTGADIFLDWLSRQSRALSVLPWAPISKWCFDPLFVIPYQILVQYVNEFPDADTCPQSLL